MISIMDIFLDTEFTDLRKPRLISLGFVTDDGHEFYRELTDSWKIEACTLFVIGWVLPLLSDRHAHRKLYSKLDQHLDVVQYWTDFDNQFPDSKLPLLEEALEANSELQEHSDFLKTHDDIYSIKSGRNPFLTKRLNGLNPEKLLTGAQSMTSQQVVEQLIAWLDDFGQPITIHVDSNFDKDLLEKLLEDAMLEQVSIELLCLPPNTDQLTTDYYRSGGRRHHALDDAKALRLIWKKM